MDETKETGGGHASILDAVLHQQQAHAADMAIDERLRQLLATLPQRDREIIEGHLVFSGRRLLPWKKSDIAFQSPERG